MAFPAITSATATGFSLSVTTMAVSLPASISSGDLLLAYVELRNGGTWTVPTDWVELGTQLGGSSVGKMTVFYKIADGTEGATATWTASVATSAVWRVHKITSWHGTTPPEMATSQGDFSTAPNPPSVTPSWGAEDTLWVAIAANTAGSVFVTGAPTNYSNYALSTSSSGGAQVNLASATRELNASSEDPGEFANPGSVRYWAAANVAVRPATAASGTKVQINIGDSWKTMDAMKINIGDSWKTVIAVKQNIGDTWKSVF